MSLVRSATTVGGFTLVSRVSGFAREILMARWLGAGMAADAFLVAFRLPNLFRSLFAEGAFSAAFVPMVAARMKGGDTGVRATPAALGFAEDALALLLPILFLFTALMMLAAGPVVWMLTGGFRDAGPEKLALTVELTRLTFPYLLCLSVVALLGGVLNALGRFAVNAAAPIALNLVLIGALVLFRGQDSLAAARALAVGVAIAGVAQLLWLAREAGRLGVLPRLRRPRLTREMRQMLARIGPAALGAGATQINLLISTMIAARLLPEGSVAWLYYADRLNQLPLGILGVGMGVALLPAMARMVGGGDRAGAIHQQNRAIEFVLLLGLPAALALMVAAQPLFAALFQHGRFLAEDARQSALALSAFAAGLPAYLLVKVLTPGFHARGDTKTPMRIALAAILANIVGNLTLIWPLGHVGIALSTALAAWLNAFLLWWLLRRRGEFAIDPVLARRAPRMALAALVMAAALWWAGGLVGPMATGGLAERLASLALLLAVGLAVYLPLAQGLGAMNMRDLVHAFRRPISPGGR